MFWRFHYQNLPDFIKQTTIFGGRTLFSSKMDRALSSDIGDRSQRLVDREVPPSEAARRSTQGSRGVRGGAGLPLIWSCYLSHLLTIKEAKDGQGLSFPSILPTGKPQPEAASLASGAGLEPACVCVASSSVRHPSSYPPVQSSPSIHLKSLPWLTHTYYHT